jgi:hypothetical protein
MLGIIYMLYNTVRLTVGFIKEDISNTNLKEQAKQLYNNGENRAHIYVDTRGCSRDLRTNHKVHTYRDKNRDLIVKDLRTGEERNIDKPIRMAKYNEEKRLAIDEARKNGGIAPFGAFMEKEYRKTFLFCKDRYIDIHGNIYIKKYMIWNLKTMGLNESDRIGVFYININTCKIDYADYTNAGKLFKHCVTVNRPYVSYKMVYATEKESEEYKEYFNNYLYNTKEEPLKFIGKFTAWDYKH